MSGCGGALADTDYTYENGVLTILSGTPMTLSNLDPVTATTDHIVVPDGVTANLTLAGVNIGVSGSPALPGTSQVGSTSATLQPAALSAGEGDGAVQYAKNASDSAPTDGSAWQSEGFLLLGGSLFSV